MRLNFTATKLVQRSLYPLLSFTIPLLLYTAVLVIGVPNEVSFAARYGFTTVVIAIALLVYPAYRLPGWIGTLASLSLTLILFALPLSALWNGGISDGFIIGGLLPWSDASVYYWDARRLLEGGTFSALPPQRPLFPGILATLLGLTQQNLQVTLAILVAITAISCFFIAREVQRSHGIAAGLLVIGVLFLFYRRFIGKTSTETLGLTLGAVGFAILWRGARHRQINHCLLGILILTLALNARAGAFFILPALILWGAWSFRGSAHFSRRFLIGGSSVVLFGFILNSILLKIIGSPEGIAFSNFSYTLYGLIVGGNWTQVLTDHPELKFADIRCQPGMDAVYIRISPGSSINLVADDVIQKTHLPNIRLSDFKNRVNGNGIDNFDILYPGITKVLTSLSSSTTLMNTFNLRDWKRFLLIADSTRMPKENGIVGVCGKLTTNSHNFVNININYDFFYAESIERVSR